MLPRGQYPGDRRDIELGPHFLSHLPGSRVLSILRPCCVNLAVRMRLCKTSTHLLSCEAHGITRAKLLFARAWLHPRDTWQSCRIDSIPGSRLRDDHFSRATCTAGAAAADVQTGALLVVISASQLVKTCMSGQVQAVYTRSPFNSHARVPKRARDMGRACQSSRRRL
jgi:hypothetical protein